MNISLPIAVMVVVAVIIVGVVFLQSTSTRKVHTLKRGRPKKARPMQKSRDEGSHIAKAHGHERSPEWSRVAKEHRLREPVCMACGYKGKKLQVHHIKPFHLHPHLELDPHNLITLCEARGRDHHLLLGHLGAWDSYNEHIHDDVKRFYRKTAAQIRADAAWQRKMAQRP